MESFVRRSNVDHLFDNIESENFEQVLRQMENKYHQKPDQDFLDDDLQWTTAPDSGGEMDAWKKFNTLCFPLRGNGSI